MRQYVREFHRAYGVPVLDRPSIPYADRVALRRRLIEEEFEEVMQEFDIIQAKLAGPGFKSADDAFSCLARLAKELADLHYVIDGTELEFGIPGDEVYAEVHRSNMSKLDDNGRPIRRHDGKVMKGPNYFEANVMSVLGVVDGTVG